MSLSEWLDRLDLGRTLEMLNVFRIQSTHDLAILHENDFDDISTALELDAREKQLFENEIRKLQRGDTPAAILQLDLDGQQSIQKMVDIMTNANASLRAIEKSVRDIVANSNAAKKAVAADFAELRKNLQIREEELIAKIEEGARKKLAVLEKQRDELKNVILTLTEIQRKRERLMRIRGFEGAESRLSEIKNVIAKIDEVEFQQQPAKDSVARYEFDSITITNLKKHGTIGLYGSPVINKVKATSNSIVVYWELSSEENIPNRFGIKLQEFGDGEEKDGIPFEPNLVTEFEIGGHKRYHKMKNLKGSTNYKVSMKAKRKEGWGQYGDESEVRTKR